MTLQCAQGETRCAAALFVAALGFGMVAADLTIPLLWSAPAFAGSSNAGSSGNGNGGSNGNAGGSGNAGGQTNGRESAGGNGKGNHGGASSEATPEAEVESPASATGLRESGAIRPLAEIYGLAERQLGAEVIDAALVADEAQGWTYDLRLVTEDGHVRTASYDAATLVLRSLDGEPIE